MFLLFSSLFAMAQEQIAILYPTTIGNKEYPLLQVLHNDLQLTTLAMVGNEYNILDENYIYTEQMIKSCDLASCSVEIGKVLGADYVVETQFVDLSDSLTFILKVYNVHTGKLITGFTEKHHEYNNLSSEVVNEWEKIVVKQFGDNRNVSYVTQDQVDYWKNLYKLEYQKNMQRHVEYTQKMDYKPTYKEPLLTKRGKIVVIVSASSLLIPYITMKIIHRATHYKVNTLDSDGNATTVWREKPNNKEETSDNTTYATSSQIPLHHVYSDIGNK
jgi:hypothetical protein